MSAVLTLATDDIRVYDDVLPSESFVQLRRFVNELPFLGVQNGSQRKIWRVRDGNPLAGPPYGPAPVGTRLSASMEEPSFVRLLDEIEDCASSAGLIEEFHGFTVAPWAYPTGSGLGPHVDGKNHYNGSYIYYLHKNWHACQGGLLLVLDPSTTPKRGDEPELPWIDGEDVERERQDDPGHGCVVLPAPNRLVLLSARAEHMITTVTRGVRLSIAGFFYRPDTRQIQMEAMERHREEVMASMRKLHVSEEEQLEQF